MPDSLQCSTISDVAFCCAGADRLYESLDRTNHIFAMIFNLNWTLRFLSRYLWNKPADNFDLLYFALSYIQGLCFVIKSINTSYSFQIGLF